MKATQGIAKVKGAGIKPWRQAFNNDHFLAEAVLLRGSRCAVHMSTKHWSDPDIIEFIEVKRPIEFEGLSMEEVIALVASMEFPPMAFLWSSNNSVTVDAEFWRRAKLHKGHADYQTPLSVRARAVLERISECAYGDGTGEPGIINEDRMVKVDTGLDADVYRRGDFVGSERYQVKDETRLYMTRLWKIARKKKNAYIVNPCGNCVASDTMIMTVNGPRPVAELMAGEFNALVDGRAVRAGAFHFVGVAQICEILTLEGYRLKCSAGHWLLRTSRPGNNRDNAIVGSVQAGNLAIGDRLLMSNNRDVTVDLNDSDFEVGWAVGHIKGNGGHNPHNSSGTYLRFWHDEEFELETRADALVRSLGVSDTYRGGSWNRANNTWTIRTEHLSRLVDRYLHPRSKDIRPALLHGSAALVAGFLQGFFDSDGSPQGNAVKGRSVRLSQSNEAELLTTQQMLSRLGIMSTLALRREAGERLMPDGRDGQKLYSHKSQWEIIISKDNIEEFAKKVGFSTLVKRETLSMLIENLARKPNREMFFTRVKAINILPPEPVFDCPVDGLGIYDAGGFCSLSGIR